MTVTVGCACGAYPSEIDYQKKTICKYPRFPRRYVQFRDLVFDGQETVSASDYEVSYKYTTTSYKNRHGSYTTNMDDSLVESSTLTLDLAIPWKRLKTANKVIQYLDFIKVSFSKAGMLWAIDSGGELLWTIAKPINFSQEYKLDEQTGYMKLHITFFLSEGIWHKANASKTFLTDYDYCAFYRSLDFDGRFLDCPNQCRLSCGGNNPCDSCEGMENLLRQEELYLCDNREVLLEFYNKCNAKYKINYNCQIYADMYEKDQYFGLQFKIENDCGIVFSEFFSDTVLDSKNVEIHLVGQMTDPVVTINGTSMKIKGSYVGDLYFSNGLWRYTPVGVNTPDCYAIIDQSLVEYECNEISYTVHNGTNTIQVSGISNVTMVFLSVDAITY